MALSNLYLLKFNNYFNRYIKRLGSVSAYIAQASFTLPNTSFNPADGINTQHVVNTAVATDYVVVTDQSDSIIESRWFVIENSRNRAGQYTLTLRRDVIADYYDEIISSPCYIEKATLQPDDPFIFNPEGNGFNQIKTKETLLKDHYGIPWIVGYYNFTTETPSVTGKTNIATDIYATYDTIDDFKAVYPEGPYIDTLTRNFKGRFDAMFQSNSSTRYDTNFTWFQNSVQEVSTNVTKPVGNYSSKLVKNTGVVINANNLNLIYTGAVWSTVYNELNSMFKTIKPNGKTYNDIIAIEGKVFKIGNKYYRINVNRTSDTKSYTHPVNSGSYLAIKNSFLNSGDYIWDDSYVRDTVFRTTYYYDKCDYELSQVGGNEISVTLTADKNKLNDQPWSMFAIPYGKYYIKNNDEYILCDAEEAALNIATDLAKTTSVVYDVQIVPYTIKNGFWGFDEERYNDLPVFDFKGKFDSTGNQVNTYEIEYLTDNNKNPLVTVWYPTSCSFRNILILDTPIIITEPKIQNECDIYRIVGPNYAGAFQFNPAKNGGCSRFEINCTYLPASPYIHINPTFSGLYGSDFDDVRGLVCQGNFSISTVSDAWRNYIIQNKNYNEIFNREVENMEVNRSIEKTREAWGVGTGVLSGAVSGAVGGASVGGVVGGIVGGVVGAGASLAGGLTDMEMSQKLYDEAKSYKQDMRNYSLGNIKALPYTLSKTPGYNVDNKYFPFLEYYTCTEKEKQAFRDQLKYTGMTVMRTGTIYEFLTDDYSYIQGKMILINGIDDDFHLLKAISEEIGKGVYIK
nr:MAG TPA: major tail protein [Bacteriophage sp.]